MNKTLKKKFRLRPAHTVFIGFLSLIFIGSFLLCLPVSSKQRVWTGYLDALFTAFSAVCLTGQSVLPLAAHFSAFGQAVMLVLIQTGALGIMSIAGLILLIMKKKISFKSRLSLKDSLNIDSDKGVLIFFKRLLIMTFSFELAGTLLLIPAVCMQNGAIGIWQSLFLSVSAFCNCGADIFGSSQNGYVSLAGFQDNPYVLLVVSVLVIAGGIGFIVLSDLIHKRGRLKRISLFSKTALTVTITLIITGTVFFLSAEYNNPLTIGDMSFMKKLLSSYFQSVSLRTAGFHNFSQSALTPASKVFSCALMFIGASPGSTGGGIKTTAIAVIVCGVVSVFKGREETVLFKHAVNKKAVKKAWSVFFISVSMTLFAAVFLLLSESGNTALISSGLFTAENVLLEVFATVSTCGISAGLTPLLTPAGKIMIMITMFFARIGLLNFGTAMLKDSSPDIISYPESDLLM